MKQRVSEQLPDWNEYLQATREINLQLGGPAGVAKMIHAHSEQSFNKPQPVRRFLKRAAFYGRVVEPVDRTLNAFVDPTMKTAEAFRLGASGGALLVDAVYPKGLVPIDEVYSRLPIIGVIDDSKDEFHERHLTAEEINKRGFDGVELLGFEAKDGVEDWEMAAVPEVNHQLMFRRSLGLVVLGASMYVEAAIADQKSADMAALRDTANQIDTGNFDWDSAFQKLL